MRDYNVVHFLLIIFLGITVLLSFYILVMNIIFKDKSLRTSFNTWQFPMLLALFLDSIIFSFNSH